MTILYNPEDGAPIHDVYYKNVQYFSTEEAQQFKPGMVLQLDDDVASFMRETFGFLQEIGFTEAEKYMKRGKAEELKCDKCNYKTKVPIALEGHKIKHETEKKAAELGIPMVKTGVGSIQDAKASTQESIETEAKSGGLEGEGLVQEKVGKPAIMR